MNFFRRWSDRFLSACTARVDADDGTTFLVVADPYGLTITTAVLEAPSAPDERETPRRPDPAATEPSATARSTSPQTASLGVGLHRCVVITLALVPLLAACSGSNGLTAPAQDVAADAALAEAALLTLADFPAGWSATETDDDGAADGLLDAVYECLGPDAVELFSSDTKARSATFTDPADDSIVSQTIVLAPAITAAEVYMAGGSAAGVPACLTAAYREQLPVLVGADAGEADTTVGRVTVRTLDIRIGDAAFAYDISVTLTIDGVTIDLHSAFVAVRVGRSVTGLNFQSIIDPTSLERITAYTTLAGARLPH